MPRGGSFGEISSLSFVMRHQAGDVRLAKKPISLWPASGSRTIEPWTEQEKRLGTGGKGTRWPRHGLTPANRTQLRTFLCQEVPAAWYSCLLVWRFGEAKTSKWNPFSYVNGRLFASDSTPSAFRGMVGSWSSPLAKGLEVP